MSNQNILPFIASISAQIAAVGVLIVVPLIYYDELPKLRLSTPLPFILALATPEPERNSAKPAAQSTRPSVIPRVFRAPAAILSLSAAPSTEGAYLDAPPGAGLTTEAIPMLAYAPPPIQNAKPPQPAARPVAVEPPTREPLHVGGDIQAARIITRVIPTYPLMAKQSRISGTVRLLGVIAKDGTVQKLQVVSGHPFLARAALDAVRQWVYRPTLLNGEPIEVITPIDVIFTLQ
jgi:protein TonB